MKIYDIKASRVVSGSCVMAKVAEATVDTENGETVYVGIQECDDRSIYVSDESAYEFLTGNGEEPECEVLEKYGTYSSAKGSEYASVVNELRRVLKILG